MKRIETALITALIIITRLIGAFAMTTLFTWSITWCFGIEFRLKMALGVFLTIIFIFMVKGKDKE